MSWATPRTSSLRACQTAGIVLASSRGQPSATLPTRARQNNWPHHLRMEAMKLTHFVLGVRNVMARLMGDRAGDDTAAADALRPPLVPCFRS
jgi:hypothetical protein